MSIMTLKDKKQKQYAVIPMDEYKQLVELQENFDDLLDIAQIEKTETEESFPMSFIDELVHTDNKIRCWRKYRSLKAKQLAEQVGISAMVMSKIETNKQTPSLKQAQKIAEILKIDLVDIV